MKQFFSRIFKDVGTLAKHVKNAAHTVTELCRMKLLHLHFILGANIHIVPYLRKILPV